MSSLPKGLIIVLDGLGDRPIAEFNGLTPLEKAQTPFFDQLAAQGMCAMVNPLTPGLPVGTHIGMALLMGLAPKDAAHLARGPVEAAGINLAVQPGDVILRCNFAHIEAEQDRLKVLDRRAGRINQQTDILAQALNLIELPHGIKATFYPTTQHRAVLHLQGRNISANISNTDSPEIIPGYVQPCKPLADEDAAFQTAEAINFFSNQAYQILQQHPVNQQRIAQGNAPASGILCRSPGKISSIHNLLNYYKIKTAVVSAESTVIGLGKLFGFTNINQPTFTALPDTDLSAKVTSALQALKTHDLVYLHIKGTDICAHDHQAKLKTQFIEEIDQALADIDISDMVIAVTADHSTNTNSGLHSGDPVPSICYSPYGRRDKTIHYSEQDCMRGGLGSLSSNAFLLTILDQMGQLHNFKKEDTLYLESI
ncbi:MAG: 2,3-bisphosphoglycerate-independent phosphoglycerate mutase [gamma proteobacterium symbiont of Taylorina sp.]|nr:2,3-bisphosphoglycerate-independent phosphoglycerate mutase [gamma proteobacterium symbiont of Taylorina sp.]